MQNLVKRTSNAQKASCSLSLSGLELTCNYFRKNYLVDLTFSRAVLCFGRAIKNVKQTTLEKFSLGKKLLLNTNLFYIVFVFNLVYLVSHEKIIQKGI